MNTLLDEFPLPWKVLDEENKWTITAANDDVVMSNTSYTGDGDRVYLDLDQARELCDLVNREVAPIPATRSGPQPQP